MTTQEQYTLLLEQERENELIPFLKSLEPDQRKLLGSLVKKLASEYFKYNEVVKNGNISYNQKATKIQDRMLKMSVFACCNRVDFEKVDDWGWIVREETLQPILSWYCPSWFSDYLNQWAELDRFPAGSIPYHWIMDLTERGLIVPTKELIVKLIPSIIFEEKIHPGNHWEQVYTPENLLKRKITLEEHLWYIFELASNINWTYQSESDSGEEIGWIPLLKRLSLEGKVDRERLLKESLLATTRNFNRLLSGWHAELFIQLQPSKEELLRMQNQLFIAFNSPHSKPVNAALNCLKKLVGEEGFKAEDFLDHVPLLLGSETKSIVASALTILEKIAARLPALRENVCLVACQALVHKDAAQQKKVASLLVQYGDSISSPVWKTLAQYEDSLLVHTKSLLADFMIPAEKSLPETSHSVTPLSGPTPRICAENKIASIEHFEDLLFLASQAFDNNQSYHLDLLPTALIGLQHQMKAENIAKLEPAFQRAYKTVLGNWQSAMASIDQMLAIFFINYGQMLIGRFPKETLFIQALHKKYVKEDQEKKADSSYYVLQVQSLEKWQRYRWHISGEEDTLLEPFKQVLLYALAKLKNHDALPLLSTPTHTPGWIDPLVLIDRLSQYQAKGVEPNGMDLQIAIARLALENKEEALRAVEQKLTGEYQALLRFLLIETLLPEEPFTLASAWVMATLTKNPPSVFEELPDVAAQKISRNDLTGQYHWKVFIEEDSYNHYDYSTKQAVIVRYNRGIRRIELQDLENQEAGVSSFSAKVLSSSEKKEPLFYEYLSAGRNCVPTRLKSG